MLFDLTYSILDYVDIPDYWLSLKIILYIWAWACPVGLSVMVINYCAWLLVRITSCIHVIYSRYMLHDYSCYLFLLPVTRVLLLHISVPCYTDIHVIYSCSLHDTVHAYIHYYSTYHLESTSCIPVTGSCCMRCHRHLSYHVLTHPHCNANHLRMGRLDNWPDLTGWVFESIIVSLQRTR